jgi:hypothetical protein
MVIFREVEVFPNGGFADRPWVDEDPDEDAFARVARGVCETYSQALPRLGLAGKASLLRLGCWTSVLNPEFVGRRPRPAFSAPASTAVEVHARFIESFEDGLVWVPAGFAGQPLDQQRAWTLRVVHEAACQLAQVRGWDPAVLESAREHAEAQDLRLSGKGRGSSRPIAGAVPAG